MTITCPKCDHTFYVPSRRTSKQSRWFHAALHRFAEGTGMDFATAKLWLKNKYGAKVHVGVFLKDTFYMDVDYQPELIEWPGQNYRDGDDVWFLKSESAYNRGEETELGNGLIVECAENGIDIDDLVKGAAK